MRFHDRVMLTADVGGIVTSNPQRNFHRLFVVQARVNLSPVSPFQVLIRKPPRAARAFGHVIASQFQMHAA